MSFEEDEEIVQDFLVEAGEILEQLGEQLVSLEQSPTDNELLNAVFRGFHTIKGGASFIALTALVEVCHVAEDVFNQLRQGERQVDAHLMDIILQVLDVLNEMFDAVRGGNPPESASPELLADLRSLLVGRAPTVVAPEPTPEPSTPVIAAPEQQSESAASNPSSDSDDITDQEFEKLLDALDSQESQQTATPDQQTKKEVSDLTISNSSDEISENEFDELLDQLHGTGKSPTVTTPPVQAVVTTTDSSGSDDITDDEFEALLDDLHGKGKHNAAASETSPAPVVQPTVEPVVENSVPVEPIAATPDATKIEKPKPVKEASNSAQSETTVRVDTKRLDDIMNMVGELVLVRNRMVTLEAALGNEEVSQATSNLDLVTADLQSAVMKTRMQPIKKVFGRFPRVVRDLARSLKKDVNLELVGEETDLDKNLVEALADPLVHLVRNAVDHGIEMPDVRERNGKVREGTVLLAAEQEGDHILLTIKDDGGGMDPNKLREIAVNKGVMDKDAAARLEDKEAFALIFAPGFSTKEEISDISGRGVGMDVVKTRIVQLNGTIDIDSQIGIGTTLSIKVPLTLAIMPTLMVMLGDQIFALPLVSVSEIFNLDLSDTNRVDGQEVIMLRDQPLPLYFLKDWLVHGGFGQPHPSQGHVVVVSIGNQKAGFVVEQLIGQEEVVIKPLGKMLHGTKGLSGATITGDGRIALILDVPSLMQAYARKY